MKFPNYTPPRSAPVKAMVSRLRRYTPYRGYAEVEVISHPGSHHKQGDIILLDAADYRRAHRIEPELQDDELYKPGHTDLMVPPETIEKFLNSLPDEPTRSKANVDARRKSKSPSKKAAR